LPFVGSLSSKYGGYAGLSVPIVSCPPVLSCRSAFAHCGPDGLDVAADCSLELSSPPQAVRVSAAAARAAARRRDPVTRRH
jgi:hypothetical protein